MTEDARRQLTRARDGGNRLIRVVAEHLLRDPPLRRTLRRLQSSSAPSRGAQSCSTV